MNGVDRFIKIKKIMLGSAQFGMPYGIANKRGKIAENEIADIFHLAHSMQINKIDTAASYGSSEQLLGKLANNHFEIITKLSPFNYFINDVGTLVKEQYLLSLEKLKRTHCYGLLVHDANFLLGTQGDEIYASLIELKKNNKVKKIGVSVYFPQQVTDLLSRFKLDIIQFPLNLFDQRFLQNQLLTQLKKQNIELHARSIFLQGLLLMENKNIPHYFRKIKPTLLELKKECKNANISLRQALIEFVLSITEIDQVIVGVDGYQHFQEIIHDISTSNGNHIIQAEKYRCNDMNIIHPSYWKIQ